MKNYLFCLLALVFIIACAKESNSDLQPREDLNYEDGSATDRGHKRKVCHNGNIINVSINALPAHAGHGDAVDWDGDGYFTKENDCGMPVDCDNEDAEVNAGNNNCSVCTLPPFPGPCNAAIPRWYYDSNSGTCKTFIYGGCLSNGNNFITITQCEQACSL